MGRRLTGCLLVAEFGVASVVGGRVRAALVTVQIPVTALTLLGPSAIVGHRRASPVVALRVAYCFATLALVTSGNSRLTTGAHPDWRFCFHYRLLVLQAPVSAVALTAAGYLAGLVGSDLCGIVDHNGTLTRRSRAVP